ncbi:uncharacterized protein YggE [Rhodococcus sp. 27YEA15]|uniref:SIMPL domain-containing protein n=1 Tax=Rhodococcus sp. 27YEA15 TaxID=3156259 RepID=UPI003C7B5B42
MTEPIESTYATVTVVGSATVSAVPDLASLTIGVSVTDSSISSAFDAVTRVSNALTGTLHSRGISGEDVRSSGLSAHPQTRWTDSGVNEHVGFTVSTTYRVVLRDLAPDSPNSVGAVITECVVVGGDAVTVDGLEFDLEDRSELTRQARDAAWARARSTAQQYADLAGMTLRGALDVVEDSAQIVPVRAVTAAAMKSDTVGPTVERGKVEESVSVRVRFSLA